MFLVILVFANILAPIAPGKHALTLHSVVDPISLKNTAVCPNILADSVDVILLEVTVIGALVAPNKFASAMLHAFHILARVLCAIRPLFDALAVLLIVEPLPLVPTSVIVRVNSKPIGLIFMPSTLVNIALSMDEPTVPTGHTILPKAVIS
jgi:hypothetical protein